MDELGHYLVAMTGVVGDLNQTFYDHLRREEDREGRLHRCMAKLGNQYPEWETGLIKDLEDFAGTVTESERTARRAASELDAALEDPRWAVARSDGR